MSNPTRQPPSRRYVEQLRLVNWRDCLVRLYFYDDQIRNKQVRTIAAL